MQIIGFILSLLSFLALGLTVLPLLGALNWINIVHYLMIFLMILWTALLIADLVQGFLGGGVL